MYVINVCNIYTNKELYLGNILLFHVVTVIPLCTYFVYIDAVVPYRNALYIDMQICFKNIQLCYHECIVQWFFLT